MSWSLPHMQIAPPLGAPPRHGHGILLGAAPCPSRNERPIEHRRHPYRARLRFEYGRHAEMACIIQRACAESEANAAAGCRAVARGPLLLDTLWAASRVTQRMRTPASHQPLCEHQMRWGLIYCGVCLAFRSLRRPERRHATVMASCWAPLPTWPGTSVRLSTTGILAALGCGSSISGTPRPHASC